MVVNVDLYYNPIIGRMSKYAESLGRENSDSNI